MTTSKTDKNKSSASETEGQTVPSEANQQLNTEAAAPDGQAGGPETEQESSADVASVPDEQAEASEGEHEPTKDNASAPETPTAAPGVSDEVEAHDGKTRSATSTQAKAPSSDKARERRSGSTGASYKVLMVTAPVALLALIVYFVFREPAAEKPTSDPLTDCLKVALSKSTTSSDARTLDSALVLARQKNMNLKVDKDTYQTQEMRVLTENAVLKSIETCRLNAALTPPAAPIYEGVVTVVRKLGGQEIAVDDAKVEVQNRSERAARLDSGKYVLKLTDVTPTTNVILAAVTPSKLRSRPVELTVAKLVENGANLVISENFPQLTLQIERCADSGELIPHGEVFVAAPGAVIWHSRCGATPPANLSDCASGPFSQGKAKYFFERSSLTTLRVNVSPEGESTETLDVDVKGLSTLVTLSTTKGCHTKPQASGPVTCDAETVQRLRTAAGGKGRARVNTTGAVSVLGGSDDVKVRLAGARVGPRDKPCVASF